MNYKHFFLVALLIFTFSYSSFAQDKPDFMDEDKNEPKLSDEEIKNYLSLGLNGVAELLPSDNNSWSISITQTGGFIGISKVIAAVNSEGRYLCGKDDLSAFQKAPKNYFDTLSELLSQTDFSIFSEFSSLQKKHYSPVDFCRDCLVTSLTYSYRKENSKTETYKISALSFTNAEGEIKNLYEHTINAANCQ